MAFCRPVRRLRRWKGPTGQYIVPIRITQNLNPTSKANMILDILTSIMPQHCCSRYPSGNTARTMSGLVFILDPLNPESLASQMISKQHEGILINLWESNLPTHTHQYSSCDQDKDGITPGAFLSFPNPSTDK